MTVTFDPGKLWLQPTHTKKLEGQSVKATQRKHIRTDMTDSITILINAAVLIVIGR